MTRDNFWVGLFLGVLIAILGTGWLMAERYRIGREQLYERAITGMLADEVTLATAFRIAVPDARERAGAGAEAVHRRLIEQGNRKAQR